MSVPNLPFEIYVKIFGMSDRESVSKCMRVCESWQLPAAQVLYKDITMNGYTVYLAKSQLAKPEQDRDSCFKHGFLTEKLTFSYDKVDNLKSTISYKQCKANEEAKEREKDDNLEGSDDNKEESAAVVYNRNDTRYTEEEFKRLLSYMPNLKIIDFSRCENTNIYMGYLSNMDSKKYLLHIEKIKGSDSMHSYKRSEKLHFQACYNFRKTLTHLKLRHHLDYYQFPALTNLDFYNDLEEDLTLFDVQEICPNLRKLDFGSSYVVLDDVVEDYLTMMDETINTGKANSPASPLYFNRNLQKLELNFPSLSAAYIKCIIKYIPGHLHTLRISLDDIDIYDWIKQVGVDNIMELAKCLGLMKNARIASNADKEYVRSISAEPKMTRFFKLLGALKGDRKMYGFAYYTDFHPNESAMRVTDGKYLAFRYGLDYGDYFDDEEDAFEGNQVPPFEMPLPDIDKTIIGPEVIHNLTFSVCRSAPEIPYQTIKYALTHCPHLHLFDYTGMNTGQKIRISPDVRCHVDMKKCDPSSTSQENLKKIKLENVSLSTDLINLLSTRLPDLETIVCVPPRYSRYCDDDEIAVGDNLVMDITGFRDLKKLCFDTYAMFPSKFNHFFIHFKYDDSEDYFKIEPVESTGDERKEPFTFESTNCEHIEECRDKDDRGTFFVSFICNKIHDILIGAGDDNSIIGQIVGHLVDGKLQTIDSGNNSKLYFKNFE